VLLEKIKAIVFQHPGGGYRMIKAGRHSRVTQPFLATEAEAPGHVGVADLLQDRISPGRGLRIFNVPGLFTRRGFNPSIGFQRIIEKWRKREEFETLQEAQQKIIK